MSHSNQQVKVHKMRYSEFKKFNEKLEKALSQFRLPVLLPQFPGKKFFGSTNRSVKSINNRKQELQDYMNLLLQNDKLYALPLVKKIIPFENEVQIKEKTTSVQSQDSEKLEKPGNGQKYQFTIDSYQQLDDIVLYFVQVKDSSNESKWRFKTRYSDLRDIHQALKDSRPECQIPEFPKRKIFGITNESPNKIEERKQRLELYLNQIFKIKDLNETEVLTYFIENSKRESLRLQKFDDQKMMARLKLKAQQMGEKKQGDENKKQKFESPNFLKKGLFMIKESKEQAEQEHENINHVKKRKLDQINEIIMEQTDQPEVTNTSD